MRVLEEVLSKHIRAIYDMPTIGIVVSVPNKGIVDVNPALCKMLGYTRTELLEKKWTDITHPDDIDLDISFFNRIVSGEIDSYTIDKRYIHKNDAVIWIELSVECIKNSISNEIEFFVALVKNIDERKNAEQKLKNELTNSKELSKNLESRNKHLREFAHITAHNLRAPVSTMASLINIYENETDVSLRDTIVEKIAEVNTQLLETIDNLAEALEMQEGQNLDIRHTDIDYKLKRAIKFLQTDVDNSKAKISTDFSKAPTAFLYHGYLQSVFLNLVSNAIKYRSPNRDLIIDVSSDTDEKYTYIYFKDNGLGIDLNRHKHKVFGLYKTFHRNPNAKGVGLFMVKNQIEAMNGTITIESAVDNGTTFTLKFPKNG